MSEFIKLNKLAAAPANASAGTVRAYLDADGELKFVDENGPAGYKKATLLDTAVLLDVDGFLLDGAVSNGFKAEASVAKLSAGGDGDNTFIANLGSGFNGDVLSLAEQADGKIVVGGTFTDSNGTAAINMGRMNADGTSDADFDFNMSDSGGFNNSVAAIAIQTDQKILAGGYYNVFNGSTRKNLVRLNADGTEDTAFYTNLGTAFDGTVLSVAIQADGKILVAGEFNNFNGNVRNSLVRLNADGTEDTAFYTNLGTGFDVTIKVIVLDAAGKILVGGDFADFNGNVRKYLVRLNDDGTEDAAFYTNLGTGLNSEVNAIAVQSDGKIVLGGDFTDLDGNTRNHLLRLNADGTDDTAFNTNVGTGFNTPVLALVVQSASKIIAGGPFTTFDGNTRNNMVCLNSDGTEDVGFYDNGGGGLNGQVFALIKKTNGRIVLGGSFTAFWALGNRICQIYNQRNMSSQWTFSGLYRSDVDAWELIAQNSYGDNLQISFEMNAAGQMKYYSTPLGHDAEMRYQITRL